MAFDFGKLNFSTSFNPTSAFPIDARQLFASYDEAVAAAATADVPGSSTTVYYYGMPLVVYDETAATVTMYVITPQKGLQKLAASTPSGDIAQDVIKLQGLVGEPASEGKSATGLFKKIDDITIAKKATAETGYSTTYYLTKDGTETGKVGEYINIPKDMVVESGSVKTCTEADKPVAGYKVGDKYIDLVIANKDSSHLYILVSDLIDTYTPGTGIDITNNVISVKSDFAQSVTDAANTANNAYSAANDAANTAANAYSAANNAYDTANSAYNAANSAANEASNAYGAANDAHNAANNAFSTANNAASDAANAANDAQNANNAAKDAANLANTKQAKLTAENGIEITTDNKIRIIDELILDGGNAGASAE